MQAFFLRWREVWVLGWVIKLIQLRLSIRNRRKNIQKKKFDRASMGSKQRALHSVLQLLSKYEEVPKLYDCEFTVRCTDCQLEYATVFIELYSHNEFGPLCIKVFCLKHGKTLRLEIKEASGHFETVKNAWVHFSVRGSITHWS